MSVQFLISGLFALLFTPPAWAVNPVLGWNVDCGNYCSFSEFPNNCQGVFYLYPDGTKSYSSYSTQYQACQETAPLQANTHILARNLIPCTCAPPVSSPPANPSTPMSASTRSGLEILRAQIHDWAVCSPDPGRIYPDVYQPMSYRNVDTCRNFRKRGKRSNFIEVGGCYTGLLGFEDTEWHECMYGGDQSANTAQNCLFGDRERCFDLKDAQDPVTGMWYRNPYDRRHPETAFPQPLFSRDALLGLLSYVVMSKDKEALRKWLVFVRNNPKSPPLGLFNICPPRPNPKPPHRTQEQWDDMNPDDRCGLVPSTAGLVYRVAIWAGLTNADLNAIGTDLFSALSSGSLVLYGTILGEAMSAPALGGPSYQLALTVNSILITLQAGGAGNSTLLSAANQANNRTSKLNPGYHFLAQGKTATEYGAYLIRKYCKGTRPQFGVWFGSGFDGQGTNPSDYWNSGQTFLGGNYQYFGGFGPYSEKIVPGGSDCISWLNMYLGNGDLREVVCENGDELVNGACRKSAFSSPTLAAVPGIGYRLRISDAKISYTAVDLLRCPYGGTLVTAGWPDFARCYFPSGLSPAQLNPAVSYTVDPSESSPGIRYPKVNGNCPYGGMPGGSHCWVKSYAQPFISQSVRYWVDTNPSWPGVYYAKINGSCSLGGVPSGPNCQVRSFPQGFLKPAVTYFVRANPATPGVYYYPLRTKAEPPYIPDSRRKE